MTLARYICTDCGHDDIIDTPDWMLEQGIVPECGECGLYWMTRDDKF